MSNFLWTEGQKQPGKAEYILYAYSQNQVVLSPYLYVFRRGTQLANFFRLLFFVYKNKYRIKSVLALGLFGESNVISFLFKLPCYCRIPGDQAWERLFHYGLYRRSVEEFQSSKDLLAIAAKKIRSLSFFNCDSFIVQSSSQLTLMNNWFKRKCKITVIQNPYTYSSPSQLNEKKDGISYCNSKLYIVYIGRLVEWKRVDILLSLLTKLEERYILDIFGSGPELDKLKQLTSKLQLTSRVRFHGATQRDVLHSVHNNWHCFLNPSIYEGMSNTTLDMMAWNVPCLINQIPANAELLKSESQYIWNLESFYDLDAIARKILQLLSNEFSQRVVNAQKLLFEAHQSYSSNEVFQAYQNVVNPQD